MKTQGKVNKRLFSKTELADQKVELRNLDVLKSKSRYLKENVRTAKTIAKEYKKISERRESMLSYLTAESKDFGNQISLVKKALKDLGISTTPPELSKAMDLLGQIVVSVKDLK